MEKKEKEIDELKLQYKEECKNNLMKLYKTPTLIGLNNIDINILYGFNIILHLDSYYILFYFFGLIKIHIN